MASSIVDDLLDDGAVARGWLGVGIQDLDANLSALLRADGQRGVVVNSVAAGSPAEAAGAEPGDVVVRFNGAPMEDAEQFRQAVAAAAPGSRFTMEVSRNGKQRSLAAELGQRPGGPTAPVADAPEVDPPQEAVGLSLRAIDPGLRAQLDLPERLEGGVVVMRVAEESPAARAGLRTGDIIMTVNRTPVRTPADVAAQLERAGDRALVLVARGGSTLFRVIER
jgi:S1-C subfamily serine protease